MNKESLQLCFLFTWQWYYITVSCQLVLSMSKRVQIYLHSNGSLWNDPQIVKRHYNMKLDSVLYWAVFCAEFWSWKEVHFFSPHSICGRAKTRFSTWKQNSYSLRHNSLLVKIIKILKHFFQFISLYLGSPDVFQMKLCQSEDRCLNLATVCTGLMAPSGPGMN